MNLFTVMVGVKRKAFYSLYISLYIYRKVYFSIRIFLPMGEPKEKWPAKDGYIAETENAHIDLGRAVGITAVTEHGPADALFAKFNAKYPVKSNRQ